MRDEGGGRDGSSEMLYPKVKEVSDIRKVPRVVDSDRIQNVKNKGGDEIRESIPNAKDRGTIKKGIGIIIPNGIRRVKGWTTNKTDSKEGLMIAFLVPLKVVFAGC